MAKKITITDVSEAAEHIIVQAKLAYEFQDVRPIVVYEEIRY